MPSMLISTRPLVWSMSSGWSFLGVSIGSFCGAGDSPSPFLAARCRRRCSEAARSLRHLPGGALPSPPFVGGALLIALLGRSRSPRHSSWEARCRRRCSEAARSPHRSSSEARCRPCSRRRGLPSEEPSPSSLFLGRRVLLVALLRWFGIARGRLGDSEPPDVGFGGSVSPVVAFGGPFRRWASGARCPSGSGGVGVAFALFQEGQAGRDVLVHLGDGVGHRRGR